ncbi:neocarzinostatin apoprotein domain-containing protein [Nocardia sp. NPDC003482]
MIRTTIRSGIFAAAAVTAAVTAAPAHAYADLSLSASDGVSAGQTIGVSLSGLDANLDSVAVGQCKAQVSGPADCNLAGSLLGKADADGVWQPRGGSAVTLVGSIGGVDCAAAPGACVIAVTSLTDPGNILTSVPLTFG